MQNCRQAIDQGNGQFLFSIRPTGNSGRLFVNEQNNIRGNAIANPFSAREARARQAVCVVQFVCRRLSGDPVMRLDDSDCDTIRSGSVSGWVRIEEIDWIILMLCHLSTEPPQKTHLIYLSNEDVSGDNMFMCT
ncbi:regulatory protein [Anopheles sinensis]|uniref:Regulatory protein n=1 Tax=Anopheles sinensis TaxID=74873 RepID=A0A084VGI0_ANOSI|nr:regulatory protein [Anopheles sinensis]